MIAGIQLDQSDWTVDFAGRQGSKGTGHDYRFLMCRQCTGILCTGRGLLRPERMVHHQTQHEAVTCELQRLPFLNKDFLLFVTIEPQACEVKRKP